MVGEGDDSFAAAAIPQIGQRMDSVVCVGDSVYVVVLSLVVEAAVEGDGRGPRAVDDVVLEGVPAAGYVTVESAVTTVIRPTVPDK